MKNLVFKESDIFFEKLDACVAENKPVTVLFNKKNKMELDSKLLKRIAKCKNWRLVESEIKKTKKTNTSALLSRSAATSLAAMSLFGLIAFIAAVLAGLGAYAVYKGRSVKIVHKVKYRNVEYEAGIEIS
ncbi:hypothetical protein [Photobacterium kishitanii]|uniref:Uncharacterized protein n=1 Tax=Photobacterium kishitanii TaxID=318456 RepID=A0A2T3KLY8_9GAMM|nr:hypothetical protein [Photobacterium kishitanii]PSV00696.1 hypothetical protein C9J27_06025 [Photobacterium kishitanii]